MTARTISYGSSTKTYTLIRKERKSIQLTVTPEMDIIVTCPERVPIERIENFLRRKWRWLTKQLDFFEKYQTKQYKKEYVSGESFYYLGRQYQLVVQKTDIDSVELERSKIIVKTTQGSKKNGYTKQILDMWYKQEAKNVFTEQFLEGVKRFGYTKPILLRIAPMRRKWGSFGGRTVTLNPLLIQARKEAIDYVIAHELCHVKYKNHNKEFWEYMNRMCPGWQKEKERLEVQFG